LRLLAAGLHGPGGQQESVTLSGRDVVAEVAVRVSDVVRQFGRAEVHDVVRTRLAVQAGEMAHPVGDRVVRAGRVAANPEPVDHLPVRVERDSAPKCDDTARNLTNPRPLRLKCRVEGVGIVQPMREPAGKVVADCVLAGWTNE
jgi:hypothetical protein